MYTCGRHTSTQWTFLFFVLFWVFLRKEKKNQYECWPLGQTSVSQLHRGPSLLPPHFLSVRRDERIWYKNRWRNTILFPPFAPCFKCSWHHGSDEKRRRECELRRERRDLIWLSLFFSLFFFFFDSEDSATHRSLRYVFLYQASTHFVSVLSRPADPPSPPFVSAHCHCDPLLACWLVKRTDGRKDWASEEVYLCTDKQKKKKTQLFDFEWQLVAANLLRCILQSFYLYRISRINDDTVTLR